MLFLLKIPIILAIVKAIPVLAPWFTFDDLVISHQNDGFVKSSRCKAREFDGRGNPPGCPISGGSASRPYLPQRFTPLDNFQKRFPLELSGGLSLNPKNGIVI
jgi:hypothetical protein